MKKAILFALVFTGISVLQAQTLNDKGLYVDSEGDLFSGTISKQQENVRCELQVKDGQLNGQANYYYASGKLMESGQFLNGQKNQKWERYNENGQVSAIAFYNFGKKDGNWVVFDDKGNKRYEMSYTDGKKSGVWLSYDASGVVIEKKDYSTVN
jgi:antitoxin component YwqK of YwqJK toxin-antitoxin module